MLIILVFRSFALAVASFVSFVSNDFFALDTELLCRLRIAPVSNVPISSRVSIQMRRSLVVTAPFVFNRVIN